MTTVIAVDDHPVVAQGVAFVLEDDPELTFVGAAGSAGEADGLVQRTRPDVVLLDVRLPDRDVVATVRDITRQHWLVNIRKFVLPAGSLDELVGLSRLTTQAARFLDAAIEARLNVIAAAGTQAGNTTLLNALAGAIPGRERVRRGVRVLAEKL